MQSPESPQERIVALLIDAVGYITQAIDVSGSESRRAMAEARERVLEAIERLQEPEGDSNPRPSGNQ